jgi:hypothetical protein
MSKSLAHSFFAKDFTAAPDGFESNWLEPTCEVYTKEILQKISIVTQFMSS